jgi:hypothetical protein
MLNLTQLNNSGGQATAGGARLMAWLDLEERVPNKRIECARDARPTRNSEALLLAAQPRRYVS